MVCETCGRMITNEDANFCEYCGMPLHGRGSFSEDRRFSENKNGNSQERFDASWTSGAYRTETNPYAGQDNTLTGILAGTAGTEQTENSMGFKHWIVVLLLPYIPAIGAFAYLILLLVWAFGKTASTTRKNWARATLIMFVVAIIFMVYMLQVILPDGNFQELLNGFANMQK